MTIVNSTAPGTAAQLAPFFQAVADSPGVDLVVLEHADGNRSSVEIRSADGRGGYRLTHVPTYFYNRRHACAQVLRSSFRNLLADSRPDIVHILGEPGYLSTYQVVRYVRRRLPGVRVCLFTAQNVHQRFPPPFPSIERWVLGNVHHAFPIGQDHEEVLRRKGYRGPVTRLPLGVDTQVFRPAEQKWLREAIGLTPPVAGYVGEFLPSRSLPLLVEAASLCSIPVHLLLVGDGAERENLHSLVREKGLGKRTHFVGRVPPHDVPKYINCMDVLVLPSRSTRNRCFGIFRIANREQFGRVLVEAMACGRPVVGSTCGEIPAVIGEAGRVFPEGDSRALALILEELCADGALRDGLARAGLARSQTQYDWRVIAQRMLTAMHGMSVPMPAIGGPAPAGPMPLGPA
jgi:glycosyltransferase involved in cell wall biosynthesis